LIDIPSDFEVGPLNTVRADRGTERLEGGEHSLSVLGIRANQDVEIACRSRDTVQRQGVSAHDDKLHFGLDEGPQYVEKVAVESRFGSHWRERIIRPGA